MRRRPVSSLADRDGEQSPLSRPSALAFAVRTSRCGYFVRTVFWELAGREPNDRRVASRRIDNHRRQRGAVPSLTLSLTHGVLKTMMLRKAGSIAVAIVLFGATTGSFAVWAHWPAKTHNVPELSRRHVQPLNPDGARPPTQDTESAPRPGDSATPPKPAGDDLLVIDCPIECLPDYCPISMAASAVSKIIGHFHQ